MVTDLKSSCTVHIKISDYVAQYAIEKPEQEALVSNGERINYLSLNNKVDQCAKALIALGVAKGDRVAMLCAPNSEYYVVFLATVNIGAIWLGLNPKYSLNEYRHAVEDAKPKVLLSMEQFSGRNYIADIKCLFDENEFIENLVIIDSNSTTIPSNNVTSYDDFLIVGNKTSNEHYQKVKSAVQRLDPALIVYTSGSTGKPKGAVLSHYGLCFGATVQTEHFQVENPSVICNMPINHVACVADICCTTLVKGGCLHFQENFDPVLMLQTISKEKIKIWVGVPTMFLLQLKQPKFEQYDLSSIELTMWGGSAMPEAGIRSLQHLNARMMTLYGMTETSAHTIYSSEYSSLESLRDKIGKPDPNMPCRLVNEHGIPCQVNEHGEIQFKGEYLMLGYYNQPEATKAAFTKEGWFHTGDLGYYDDNGDIALVGRISDMYKSGGYNIYPREIELMLESHNVIDAAIVVNIPDPLFQEVGVAFVTTKSCTKIENTQLVDFCKESLANYKIPKEIIQIKEFPMLPIGKVDKAQLKEIAINLMN
jgi:acyl-CoA synthetase (AMP-forming)/AMP-acid ligase II